MCMLMTGCFLEGPGGLDDERGAASTAELETSLHLLKEQDADQ